MFTKIERFCITRRKGEMGCFGEGRLYAFEGASEPLLTFLTVECPWVNNVPSVSCVPLGRYKMEPHTFRGKLETWAIVGETVSHWKSAKPRYACIYPHVANTADEIEGCAGFGDSLGVVNGRWAVLNSGATVDRYLEALAKSQDRVHDLLITVKLD